MSTLDLNAYGVEEMNADEVKTVNGGSLLSALIFAVVVVVAIIFAEDGNPKTVTTVDGKRAGK